MALDNFRRTDIVLDKVEQKIDLFSPLIASKGEYNGRTLRVQITNGGVIEAQTCDLHFGFICEANHNMGYVVADKVDASKGIFEVRYPSEMLEVAGIVACGLKIVESAGSGKASISIPEGFSVTVKDSVFNAGMEVAENSIRVFDKAILDLKEHERRIVLMELNFKELSKMLTTNIPNMDVAVSTRFSAEDGVDLKNQINRIKSECLLTKNKVDDVIFNWPTNLSEKVNRHLDNYQVKHLKGSVRNSSGSFETVLNVTGEGEIYNLFIRRQTNYRGYHGKHVYIKLSFVDKNDRSRVVEINTSQDSDNGYGQCVYQFITYNNIAGMVDKKYLEQTTRTGDSRNKEIEAEELQLYNSVTHFADRYYVTVLKNPLYFKNLKIELRHDNPDGDETVDYEMHYGVKV